MTTLPENSQVNLSFMASYSKHFFDGGADSLRILRYFEGSWLAVLMS